MFRNIKTMQLGFSLVEVVIVSAMISIVFGGLVSAYKYTNNLINSSKGRQTAVVMANDRMEYFRSLPYNDVGTLLGIPTGTIAQNNTLTLNSIKFYERVLVEYVDDAADGIGGADSNGIVSDYKRVKAEYSWSINNSTSTFFLVSNIVPRSVESTAGGGTVRVNAIDSDSTLLPGASVRLVNNTTSPNIDVTKFSDISGVALFSGAPASSDYEVIVTGPIGGDYYSIDQTYEATISNPIPATSPFTVLEADVSTLTFQIGELSDLNVETYSVLDDEQMVEDFLDMSGVAISSSLSSDGDNLVLSDTLGVYETLGSGYLSNLTPVSIYEWSSARVIYENPANTDSKVRFYTGIAPGPYTLIPDGDLSGNSTGFTQQAIDLSSLGVATYPSIVVGLELSTSDTSATPIVDEIRVFYRETKTSLGSVSLDIVGTKTIGQELDSTPIYKYDDTFTTDVSGEETLVDLEFDVYTLTPQGLYDVATACSEHPVNLQAGINTTVEVLMVPDALNTLRVIVKDSFGDVIPGAEVNLTRAGYDVTHSANTCGQSFFTGALLDETDYVLTVTATGYSDDITNPFTVSEDIIVEVVLN